MKIGIIGAGMIGSTVGKLWVKAGHDVRFASRRLMLKRTSKPKLQIATMRR